MRGRHGFSGTAAVRVAAVVLLGVASLVGFADRTEAAGPLPPTTFTEGSVNVSAAGLALGDLEGDGDLDLVAVDAANDTVWVALGNGDGTFAAKVGYTTGDLPTAVALGDLDGDGDLDVVTAGNQNLSVLLDNGDGTFSTPTTTSFAATPSGVVTGDVNEDGKLDLAVTLSGTSILLGNGDGTFAAPYTVYTGKGPTFAYVNGDTHLDLVTSDDTSSSHRVSVQLGDGAGAFTLTDTIGVLGGNPHEVAVADLDLDGDADVVVSSKFDHSVSVALGSGDGKFGSSVRYGGSSDLPSDVAVGDLNGDTFPDLVIADSYAGSTLRLGNGDGTFGGLQYYSRSGAGTAIAMGDLNGDSSIDAVIAKQTFVSVVVNTTGLALGAPVASAGSDGVTVTWTPPADDSTVTHYEVITNGWQGELPPPVVTYSPTTNSAVVANLINGNTYNFQVSAHNAVGSGPNSSASNAVVPATGLAAPTIGTATPDGMGGVAVSWTPPAADGGSPVTGYVVTPYVGYFAFPPTVFNSTATTQSITNLQAGQTFRFRVRAINSASSSTYSKVTNAITAPQPMAPQAPTGATAVAGNGQATVSWTAPSHNGGSAITSYVVTAYVGYYPIATRDFDSNATTQIFTGLTNGTTYRFRVQANNDFGTGAFSKVSNPVTPTA
jgi:hypothetical protein